MVKNPLDNAGDVRDADSIPGLERPPGGGNGNHSSIIAWKIPCTEGLQAMGLQKGQTRLSRHALLST